MTCNRGDNWLTRLIEKVEGNPVGKVVYFILGAKSVSATLCSRGLWRSLVAHFVWDEDVAGSNPVSPT
jgi:hypothetical protein